MQRSAIIRDDIVNRIYDHGRMIKHESIKDNPEKAYYSRDGIAKFTFNGKKTDKPRAMALTVFREIEKISKQEEQEH